MQIGQSADLSPYRVFKASAAIEGGAFTAVSLTENGVEVSSEIPFGLLTAETGDVAAGEEVNVQIIGGGLWLAAAEIKAGDLLSSDESGKAVVAETGKYIFAQALESGSAGQIIAVQIIRGGMKG